MDALILSCGTGGGHDSAAKAMLEELQRQGHRATMLNPYTLQSQTLARRINNVYITMVRKTPRLFGAVYTAGQLYRKLPGRSPVYYVNRRMVPVMRRYLSEHAYDVIIMTHLYPAEILTNMKNRGIPIPKTVFVSTDYVCIPFLEETACDAYITPASDLTEDYVRRGLPAEKLFPLGIPISRVFAKIQSKAEARARLHLDPQKKYILIAGGSMGGGTIQKAIQCLTEGISDCQDVELIVVCGSNQELYEKLTAVQPKNTLVIGYTDEMADFMRSSDLFITKPGGLSSTEGAVCGVPICHTAAIPGCELYNAEYFRSHGMSVMCRNASEVFADAMALLSDPEKCGAMVECQKHTINPSAAADICLLAQNLIFK